MAIELHPMFREAAMKCVQPYRVGLVLGSFWQFGTFCGHCWLRPVPLKRSLTLSSVCI
jgi:hypothetical protein